MKKDRMFYRFALYGFLKNLRFFEPFIILFFREANLSYLKIGLLFSIRDLATNLLELPTGVFADAFGRRMSMVLAFTSYIIAFMVFFVARSFYLFSLAMILFAAGEAFRSGTHKALILEYLDQNNMKDVKVSYYGRTRAASQLGSAVNSLIAAALVFYAGGYRFIFVASTVPYALDLINLATYPKSLDGEIGRRGAGVCQQLRDTLSSFAAIFRNPTALRALLNSSGFDAFFKATKDYLQPVLKSFALALPILVALQNTRRSAIIIGLVYFCIYLLTSVASRNADRVSRGFGSLRRALNLTFASGALLLLLAGIAVWQRLDVLSITIFLGLYVLHNVRRPMNVAYISDQIPQEVMASGLSAESQMTTILMVLLAPLLGACADALGVGAGLAVLGLIMLLVGILARVRETASQCEAAAC